MTNKLEISFLQAGRIVVDRPPIWDVMDTDNRQEWASESIRRLSEEQLKIARDSIQPIYPLHAENISDGKKTYVTTTAWDRFDNGGGDLIDCGEDKESE